MSPRFRCPVATNILTGPPHLTGTVSPEEAVGGDDSREMDTRTCLTNASHFSSWVVPAGPAITAILSAPVWRLSEGFTQSPSSPNEARNPFTTARSRWPALHDVKRQGRSNCSVQGAMIALETNISVSWGSPSLALLASLQRRHPSVGSGCATASSYSRRYR
jgi:hypothetical protein